MKNQMFIFKKVNNRWKSEVNYAFVSEMITAHGLPIEVITEKIQNMTSRERFVAKIKSWKVFVKENNVNIKPIRKELESNRDRAILYIDKILKL